MENKQSGPRRTQSTRSTRPYRRTSHAGKPATDRAPDRSQKTVEKTTAHKADVNAFKILPLGGQEEGGRNMTVFEYKNDIAILDMGLMFPEENMPGIDYIIPDTRYLKGKEKNIRGVILSHGHLDHIGAVTHLLPKLGWPAVYASKLTLAMVRKRLEEAKLETNLKAFEIKSAKEKLRLGSMTINFFDVTHSIMDSFGVVIQTPNGSAIHMGDWRYDLDPAEGPKTDFSELAKWNNPKRPSMLMMESLGSTKPGHQKSTKEVMINLDKLVKDANGRIIIATFGSMVERVGQLISIAEKYGKKVALDGYSMKMNIEIAKKIGYIKFNKNTVIDISQISDYADNKVVVICTGAQGEDRAVLMRIATGQHRHVKVMPKDTIVFSSSVIPGNERTIQTLKDKLYRLGANVLHQEVMDVHASGHALQEDIKLLIKQVKPTYLMPVYANHYLLKEAEKVVLSTGFPKDKIFVIDNGNIIEWGSDGPKISSEKVPIEYVYVDGLGVGDISHVVLRDRQMMAGDGMIVVIATIDTKKGQLINNPDLISRGFIYMKENKKLIEQTRRKVKKIFSGKLDSNLDENYYKDKIRNEIGQFLYNKTQRRPMVLPVIISI